MTDPGQTRSTPTGPPLLEIACDESGSEGEKLVGGNTAVFAHAGVHLSAASAASCFEEVRSRAPSPTLEYKSDVIRRRKHREALKWMLGPSAPLLGNAHVLLIDKPFHALTRAVGLLAPEREPEDMAATLYHQGPPAFGHERWNALLEGLNDLMRTRNGLARPRNGRRPDAGVDSVFQALGALRLVCPPGRLNEILGLLQQGRPHAETLRARQLAGGPPAIPALDPLVPAIVQAVAHWGAGGNPVSIVHDRQTLLTEERVTRLRRLLAAPRPAPPGHPPAGWLAGLRLVDSRSDPRVQLADLLAGAARQIAEEELGGLGDEELTALLRPHVLASSVWGDARSRPLLAPAARTPT
ncbi:DUF3800 domain-containing protein [Nonomuraea lactucae]|uniref:DUF3800 domain-containing protein n=1 Tax=Nonomuraea lactucae TaxID=2249762 RepID=UPI000DE3A431|nr:DUF3800 domain-containing protein [Nonomuraea lactucae]